MKDRPSSLAHDIKAIRCEHIHISDVIVSCLQRHLCNPVLCEHVYVMNDTMLTKATACQFVPSERVIFSNGAMFTNENRTFLCEHICSKGFSIITETRACKTVPCEQHYQWHHIHKDAWYQVVPTAIDTIFTKALAPEMFTTVPCTSDIHIGTMLQLTLNSKQYYVTK